MQSDKYASYKIKLKKAVNDLLNHPFVKNISKQFPRTFHFILNRFSISKFSGLPLSLFILSLSANLFLLSEISENIENSVFLLSVDKNVAIFLYKVRIPAMVDWFFYFSKLGSWYVIAPLAAFAIFIFVLKKEVISIIAMLVSLSGSGFTVWLGKNYFQRVRPLVLSYYQESFYSFPSGHATIAVAFYGLVFYFLIRQSIRNKSKFQLIIAGLSFILLLGFSRLYLVIHYLSDVIAGFTLGLFWLLLSVSIFEWQHFRKKQNTHKE